MVDSAKIDAVISEIEPTTNDYAGSIPPSAPLVTGARTNRVMPCVYMGWPSEAAWDNIVVNADRVFLHCYRASHFHEWFKPVRLRPGAYGNYRCKGKGGEKDERSGYLFMRAGSLMTTSAPQNWNETYSNYTAAYNTSATADMKQWLTQDGWMVFVSQYAKEIKP